MLEKHNSFNSFICKNTKFMHGNCIKEINLFIEKYLDKNTKLKILDVGSYNVNGCFKKYFKNPNWEFIGLDIKEGRGVDVVTKDPYKYPFLDNYFDVVISGNTLEHIEDLHAIIMEIVRITKSLVWVSVPNTIKEHKYPIDCWRIFPDGMRFLLENIGKLKILECRLSLCDTIGIAKKV